MKKLLISASLIVRNEEGSLRPCLESLNTLVDEIVVTDTGSTDNTISIAREFTDRIFDFEWRDDFSVAKNFSVQQTTGDYILVIDADECVVEPDKAGDLLRSFVGSHDNNIAGTVGVISPIGTGREAQEIIDHQPRFFHLGSYHFEGVIHEQIVPVSGDLHMETTGVSFLHSGYNEDIASGKNKFQRNKDLLMRELQKCPDDEYILYQLGKAHFSVKEYGEALKYFEHALAAMNFEDGKAPQGSKGYVAVSILTDLPVSLAYSYVNVDRTQDAIDLLEKHWEMAHPGIGSADFDHALGYVYLMTGDVSRSRYSYENALNKGPQTELVIGTGSYSSLYHLGLLCEAKKDLNDAVTYYVEALRIRNSWLPVISRCIDLITEYNIALPNEVYDIADRETFTESYIKEISEFIRDGKSDKAGILIQSAAILSPELLDACKNALSNI